MSMDSIFSSKFFKENRARLRALLPETELVIITANGLLQQSADATYPFKQDGNFWYLTGINKPDIVLVIEGGKEYIILPVQSDYQKHFDGAHNIAHMAKTSGIDDILDYQTGWDQLSASLQKLAKIATLNPSPRYIEHMGFYTNPARSTLIEKIKSYNSNLEIIDVRKQFATLRMVKKAPEIQAIQSAIDVTVHTLNRIKKNIHSYTHEYQLEADVAHGFRSQGADGNAFDSIIASGKNACTLHYKDNNDKLHKNDLLLFDIGAEKYGYTSDISRTYSRSVPSDRQLQIHSAVCDVQDFAYSLLKPGVLLRDYELNVRSFMSEKLQELGLISQNDSVKNQTYFPHSTSHFLGIDVHDIGDYDRPLEPGVVITVEPGIYVPEEGIGVRIEDDILITENSIDILSKKLSRDIV